MDGVFTAHHRQGFSGRTGARQGGSLDVKSEKDDGVVEEFVKFRREYIHKWGGTKR